MYRFDFKAMISTFHGVREGKMQIILITLLMMVSRVDYADTPGVVNGYSNCVFLRS